MCYISREGEILWLDTNIKALRFARQEIDDVIGRLERQLQNIREDEAIRHGRQRP